MKTVKAILIIATLALMAGLPARATTYIKDVMLIGGTRAETTALTNSLTAQGWTFIDYDLNHGASGDYVYLLYKAEEGTNGLNRGYVTDFYLREGKGPPASLTYDGRQYNIVPYDGGEWFVSHYGDLNSNSSGSYIYLYYTKDLFPDNRAVTSITFNDTSAGAVPWSGNGSAADLNDGCGSGTDYIYMHVTTATALPAVVISGNSGEVTLQDGDILTGTGETGTCITIADGATVTLWGVSIDVTADLWQHGIECLGDATIILAGENTITAHKCGIYIPEGKTLTIRGDGSLVACTDGIAAGIGSDSSNYNGSSCGNIVIESGTITATGGYGAAGIGSGWGGSCGNITIGGGTVTATGGAVYGESAAGIGSGCEGGCGNITITTGATVVTATAGSDRGVPNSIGAGWQGTCGTVTIGGRETGSIGISPYTYRPSEATVFTVAFKANGGSGTMANQSIVSYMPQALNGNAFTRAGYSFAGWNTAANGSGTGYGDGQTVFNAGNLTLYAQWTPITYYINYNLAGGTNAGGNPSSYNAETATFTLAEPTRAGFTFAGWTWDGQSTPTKTVTIAKGSTGDRSFTANWSNANPKSSFDACSGGVCAITASGWAYDPDTPSMSISVQIKVFQSDGTTLYRETTLTADRPRNDVNTHYGITGQHGFSATFSDIPAGTYKVKAYAIDPSGEGNDPQIGSTKTAVVTPKTVAMTGETGAVTLFGGDVLTGTGGANSHILVADGATVTLSNATITAITRDDSRKWAGLTCLGDATIVLAGGTANAMKGGKATYPGIYVPVGKTLTIRGTGSLDADGRNSMDYGAAGIGGGYDEANETGIACGNIVIAGGNVTARGGLFSAGIGGGYRGACGSITVSGGTVVANGGYRACAIGPGSDGSCGNITITEGVDTVTAVIDDSRYTSHIGGSFDSTCGTVTIYEGLEEKFLDANNRQLVLYQALTLSDGSDNAAAIAGKKGRLCHVTLQGRTLHRYDGYWNALCLPFDMTAEQIRGQLGGLSGLMTLHTATLSDGTLTLNFTSATTIEAGKPYLVRWSGGADLADPTFADVTVPAAYTNAEAIAAALAAASRKTDLVDFVGNFSPVSIVAGDQTAFCLGGANTFSQPCLSTAAIAVNSCRAYFRLKGGLRAGHEVKRCVLNLGGETITAEFFASHYEAWATANGITGAWNETDALGIHNVFRYAFGKPTGAFANPPLLSISFSASGRRAVINTPPLVNTEGYTFSILATDTLDGTGDSTTYSLNTSGRTLIPASDKPARFFRLWVEEK